MQAGSALCVFQIQDLFATDNRYRVDDATRERVNVPGTVQASNWSWRLPMKLETLAADADFAQGVKKLVEERNRRSVPAGMEAKGKTQKSKK
jgi:4-alpha-glucanotransferase